MRTILSAVFFALGAHAALALDPVALDPSPDASARRVVNVVFAEYLAARPGVQVETALVDLDNDGTAEVVARFVHTSSCKEGMEECRTVVLRYDRRAWGIVLDRPSKGFETEKHDRRVPGAVRVGGVDWRWGANRYEPVGDSLGRPVGFKAVSGEHAPAYAAAFGEGAVKLAQGSHGVRFSTSEESLSSDAETMIVRMDGGVACGDSTGCPLRVLRKGEDGWSTVLSASSKGPVSVSDTVRGGYRDLVIGTPAGYVVMGWNGSAYSTADRVEAVER